MPSEFATMRVMRHKIKAVDFKVILKAFGVALPVRLFSRGDLRALKASAKIF